MTPRYALDFGRLPPRFHRAGNLAGAIGAGATLLCALAWIVALIGGGQWPGAAESFYKAWLAAWLLWLGASLGAMAIVMLHNLTGGEWGYFVRRLGQAAAGALPVLFILFLPILGGMHHLYPWARRDAGAPAHFRRPFLNPGFFILRAVAYFALWIFWAWQLRALSFRNDLDPSPRRRATIYNLSAGGLLMYMATMSLAAIDWIMSMEPAWYSSVFGFVICMGQGITAMCVMLIMLSLLANEPPIAQRLRPRHFNDLATLLVTVVILWAYNALSQLLVTWMGNTQTDIPWYVKRTFGMWRVLAQLLVFLGFFAPFILLLQRTLKQRGRALLWICVGLLAMRAIDLFWTVAPSGTDPYPPFSWLCLLLFLIALPGIGGLWVASFLWLLGREPLVPLDATDPDLQVKVDEHDAGPRPHGGLV